MSTRIYYLETTFLLGYLHYWWLAPSLMLRFQKISTVSLNMGIQDLSLYKIPTTSVIWRMMLVCIRTWLNDQTLLVKHLKFAFHSRNVWAFKTFIPAQSSPNKFCLPNNVLWCGRVLLDYLYSKADLECLTNNVWSFGKGLRKTQIKTESFLISDATAFLMMSNLRLLCCISIKQKIKWIPMPLTMPMLHCSLTVYYNTY